MQSFLKKIESLQSFLKSFHEIQINYYRALKKLTDHYSNVLIFSSENKIDPTLCQIFSLLSNICKIIKETIQDFENKIIESSNVYVKMIDNSKLISSIEQSQQSLKKQEKNLNDAKNIYQDHMKVVEEVAIENELNNNIANNKSLQKIVNITKEKEQIYKDNINLYNNSINELNKQIKKFITNYNGFLLFEKQQYQKTLNLFMSSLSKVTSCTEITIQSLSKMIHTDKTINDLMLPSYETIDFQGYSPILLDNVSITDIQKQKIVLLIKTHFNIKCHPTFGMSPQEHDFIQYVNQIISSKISSTLIEDIQVKQSKYDILIHKYLDDINYRRLFIYYLNEKRGKNNKIQTEEDYLTLLKICNYLFEVMKVKQEFEHVKLLLLLSQSFYFFNKIENKKIFIEDGLKKNSKLISEMFWIDFIEKEIQYEKENNQLQVFIALIVNITNLVGFINDRDKVMNVIKHFLKEYSFTEQEKEIIQKQIDEHFVNEIS